MRHIMELFMVITTWAGVDLAKFLERRRRNREQHINFTAEFMAHMEEFVRRIQALDEPPVENPAEC